MWTITGCLWPKADAVEGSLVDYAKSEGLKAKDLYREFDLGIGFTLRQMTQESPAEESSAGKDAVPQRPFEQINEGTAQVARGTSDGLGMAKLIEEATE